MIGARGDWEIRRVDDLFIIIIIIAKGPGSDHWVVAPAFVLYGCRPITGPAPPALDENGAGKYQG
jgi:hypothetical protein